MNESLKMQKVNVFSLEASKHKKFKRYSTYVHSRTSMPGRFKGTMYKQFSTPFFFAKNVTHG